MSSSRLSCGVLTLGVLLSTLLPATARAAGELRPAGQSVSSVSALAPVTAVGRRDEALEAQDVPALMTQADELEHAGRYSEACHLYRIASSRGHGPASLRLGELSLQGQATGHRDYTGAVHWYARARSQGVQLAALDKR